MNDKAEIRQWWAENPMTYGTAHGEATFGNDEYQMGTREFFDRLDREFYAWNRPLHGQQPFDRLFPYDSYNSESRVLEIGCGLGTMAMNWARRGVQMTAADLNPTSVEQTRRRFELHGLTGDFRLEDASRLSFEDQAFDYGYSWGVLHHSPDLERSLAEMMRVIKPGGGFGFMLYNRRSILHWYLTEYVEGFLHFEHRFLDPLSLASRYGDGHREEGNPHTWPVTAEEVRAMMAPYTRSLGVRVLGTDLDFVFKLLLPGLGLVLPSWAKKVWARRFGWSLWFFGQRA